MFGPPTSFLLLFSSFTAPPLNQLADQRILTRVRLGRTLRMALHRQTAPAAAASQTVAAARTLAGQTTVHRKSFAAGKSLTPGKGSVAAAAEELSTEAWVLVQHVG